MIWLWVILFLTLGTAGIAGLSAAPWLPTRKKELGLIHKAVQELPGDHIVDLGCGDGRILFSLARQFPKKQFTGIELSLLPYLYAKLKAQLGGYRNVQIKFGDLFRFSLTETDIVICFLLEKAYPRLLKKFRTELPNGAHFLIEAWPFYLEPAHIFESPKTLKLYAYRADSLR
jgi:trans-aconitate methyltransferase